MIMMWTVETRVITLIHIHDRYYWGKGLNSVRLAVSRELVRYCSCFRVLVIVSSVEVIKKRVTMPPQKEAGKTPNPSTMVKH